MKQAAFEQLHSSTWLRLQQIVESLEKRNPPAEQELADFSALFRKVCHFHALAIERQYSSFLVDQLEDIVVRAQQQLYRRKETDGSKFIRFFVRDFPRLVRREKFALGLATALFTVPLLLLWLGTLSAPQLVYTIIDPEQTNHIETMYNPENRVIGEAREADTNWGMFGFYIRNNISVAFRTFASGLFFGLGSAFFLIYNGAMFGAVAAHLINVGFYTPFFTFVIAHGSFELSAIVLAGAAGLKLGYALLAPGQLTRVEALRQAAQIAIRLIYGVIAMLIIAAFIEAFWSSNNLFAPTVKYLVGGLLWLLVLSYFIFVGRERAQSAEPRR